MRIQRFDSLYLKDFFLKEEFAPAVVEPEIFDIPKPPPPTFSEAQLEDAKVGARKDGFAEGFEAGYADSQAQKELHADEVRLAIQSIATGFEALQASYQMTLEAHKNEVGQLALMMAKKVAGAALTENSHAMLSAMVQECLPMLFSKPSITIELHPDIVDAMHAQLQSVIEAQGYKGHVQFRANGQLMRHDIRLDWASGHAERRIDVLWHELDTLVQRFSQNQNKE